MAHTRRPPGGGQSREAVARWWLRALQVCVQAVDYAGARPLFAEDVYAFGTHASVVRGRGALEREQWRHIWPRIRNFTFRLGEMRYIGSERGLCIIVPWDSRGLGRKGATFPRSGRATFLLVRRGGTWVALHSHFSLAPQARRFSGTRLRGPTSRGIQV